MILNRAYIISWMKPDIAEERLEILGEVVCWCESKNLKPCIIAMEWEDAWYDSFPEVDWVKYDFKLCPGNARNVALNHFYTTEEDYCIILDDDTWIAEGDDIIDWIQKASEDECKDFDLLSVTDEEFKRVDFEPSETTHKLIGMIRLVSGVFIIKNLRKHYKKSVWFNTNFISTPKGLLYGEDMNFMHRMHYEGFQAFEVFSSLTNSSRNRDITPSTWVETTIRDQQKIFGQTPLQMFTGLDFPKDIPNSALTQVGIVPMPPPENMFVREVNK